jgi:hypothetical protein
MNPGLVFTIAMFCVFPLLNTALAFVVGLRYARYGWKGIIPKLELPDGPRILSSRE